MDADRLVFCESPGIKDQERHISVLCKLVPSAKEDSQITLASNCFCLLLAMTSFQFTEGRKVSVKKGKLDFIQENIPRMWSAYSISVEFSHRKDVEINVALLYPIYGTRPLFKIVDFRIILSSPI